MIKDAHEKKKTAIIQALQRKEDFEAIALFEAIHDHGIADSIVRSTRDTYNPYDFNSLLLNVFKEENNKGVFLRRANRIRNECKALPGIYAMPLNSEPLHLNGRVIPDKKHIVNQNECEKLNGISLVKFFNSRIKKA
jgi:hypothetical protein